MPVSGDVFPRFTYTTTQPPLTDVSGAHKNVVSVVGSAYPASGVASGSVGGLEGLYSQEPIQDFLRRAIGVIAEVSGTASATAGSALVTSGSLESLANLQREMAFRVIDIEKVSLGLDDVDAGFAAVNDLLDDLGEVKTDAE